MKLLVELPRLLKPTAVAGQTQVWTCQVYDDGVGVIVTRHGKLGGKMTENRDEISKGKNAGRKNATTPTEQAVIEGWAEWETKKKRKGYAEVAADSKRFDGPMLAQVYSKQAAKVAWETAFAQPKLDGFRCLASKTEAGVVLTSREHGPFSLPHLAAALDRVLQVGEILDGEIYDHELTLQKISSLIKRPRDESEALKLVVYDTVLAAPYKERIQVIMAILGRYTNPFVKQIYGTMQVSSEAELMQYQGGCLDEGYEGAMLRWGGKGYEAGKRSASLLKVKTWASAEFAVIGAKEGRGTHMGMAIFRCVTPAGAEFDVTAPGTHADKTRFWTLWKYYVGIPLTVRFMTMTQSEQSVPFHPVAEGFKECAMLRAAHKLMQSAGVTPPE